MASTLRSCSLDLASLVYLFLRLLRKVHKPLCLFFIVHILSFDFCLLLDAHDWNFDFTYYSLSFLFISLCSFQGALKISMKEIWWAGVDSNHRPLAYQASALTG